MASLSGSVRRGRLSIPNVVFFACDVQERFRDIILQMPEVIFTGKLMMDSAAVLGVPVIVTEQYPKVFGSTVAEFGVSEPREGAVVSTFAKRKFSMMTPEVATLFQTYREAGRSKAVLFGVEAHVCVQQTCLDLIDEGVEVHLLVDGISSQRSIDRRTALSRMQKAGAVVTTSESALFDMLGDSTAKDFKAISGLVKARPATGAWGGLEL